MRNNKFVEVNKYPGDLKGSGMEREFISEWTDWEMLDIGHVMFYGVKFTPTIVNRCVMDKGDLSIDMQNGTITVFDPDGKPKMRASIKFVAENWEQIS